MFLIMKLITFIIMKFKVSLIIESGKSNKVNHLLIEDTFFFLLYYVFDLSKYNNKN